VPVSAQSMSTGIEKARVGPGAAAGALVGLLVTAPLAAFFYLGWKVARLPFVPFDIFEWVSRLVPGAVVTRGIEAMVAAIRVLRLGSTDVAAKYAEQAMAVAGLLLSGAVAGSVLYALKRGWNGRGGRAGIIVGAAAGALSLTISRDLNGGGMPVGSTLWIAALWVVWGAVLDGTYRRLNPEAAMGASGSRMQPEITASGQAPDSVERIDRRRFLVRLGGAAAAITVSGTVVGMLAGPRRTRPVSSVRRWSEDHALPNAGAALRPAPGTRPEFTPLEDHYRIDITLLPPVIKEEDWKLQVRGLVDRPTDLTLTDLRDNFRPMHQFVTLACISNEVAGDLTSTTRWTGVSLRRLLPHLSLRPEATHLKISSADGFFEIVSLETINSDERVMLTYAWDGVPLPTRHGFPLRIYIPDRYGMKQPKWITTIEAIDHWEAGYWVIRGWDREARMEATSVIDTVALDSVTTAPDGRRLVPIGGIAHAGARSISKVEVRVDEGEWREAQLRTPLSQTTWVIWRYDWPFEAGSHRFTVRCTDGNGRPQETEPSPPHPDGATGLHTVRAGR
jgi:DMSO/TMAO reductase YedYZ molybdopterin-dependent catalytic subunit